MSHSRRWNAGRTRGGGCAGGPRGGETLPLTRRNGAHVRRTQGDYCRSSIRFSTSDK